ncbi:MAG: hypothetical protein HY738_22350 [Bacteroidia bacterium]|nr:hypothetical protein [Bacteroidia bacterium]
MKYTISIICLLLFLSCNQNREKVVLNVKNDNNNINNQTVDTNKVADILYLIKLRNNKIHAFEEYFKDSLLRKTACNYFPNKIHMTEQNLQVKLLMQSWIYLNLNNQMTKRIDSVFHYRPCLDRLVIADYIYNYNFCGDLEQMTLKSNRFDSTGNITQTNKIEVKYEFHNGNLIHLRATEQINDSVKLLHLDCRNTFFEDRVNKFDICIIEDDMFSFQSKNLIKSSHLSCWEGSPWNEKYIYKFDDKGRITRKFTITDISNCNKQRITDYKYEDINAP